MAGDPYQQRYLLYGMHFFYSMISRMWDMGITLVLASLTNNNMSLIALAGLMSSLLIFLFMAQIGKQFLDIYNRLYVVRVFLLLKLCTVSVSYILCILFAYAQRENHIQSDSVKDSSMLDVSFREWIDKFPRNIIGGTTLDGMFNAMPLVGQSLAARALTFSSTDADSNMGHGTYQMMNNRSFLQSRYLESSTSSFHDTIVTNGIYIIPFLYALTNISFTCITQCIEKDWVVVLSNSNSEWLASTNATMSQIDLICASLAPTITGFLFYFYGHDTANKSASENTSDSTNVAVILLLLNALATVALLFFLTYLYNSWGQLAVRASDSPQNANYAFIDTTSKHNNTNTNESEYGSSEQDDEITIELSHRAIHSMSLEDESNIDQKALMTRQKEASYIASIFQKVSVSFISSITNFRSSNCAGVMISYAFLYCTVLSYGSLMTIYLRWAGVSDYIIGTLVLHQMESIAVSDASYSILRTHSDIPHMILSCCRLDSRYILSDRIHRCFNISLLQSQIWTIPHRTICYHLSMCPRCDRRIVVLLSTNPTIGLRGHHCCGKHEIFIVNPCLYGCISDSIADRFVVLRLSSATNRSRANP